MIPGVLHLLYVLYICYKLGNRDCVCPVAYTLYLGTSMLSPHSGCMNTANASRLTPAKPIHEKSTPKRWRRPLSGVGNVAGLELDDRDVVVANAQTNPSEQPENSLPSPSLSRPSLRRQTISRRHFTQDTAGRHGRVRSIKDQTAHRTRPKQAE